MTTQDEKNEVPTVTLESIRVCAESRRGEEMIEILLWTLEFLVLYGFVWFALVMICGLLTEWEPRTLMVGCLLWPITFLPLLVISLGCWWGARRKLFHQKLRERMK